MNSGTQVTEAPETQGWPIEVRALVTSLGVQHQHVDKDRRRHKRERFEVQGVLWYEDPTGSVRRATVYTRDRAHRTLAFVGSAFLKAGQSIVLDLPRESGAPQRLEGQTLRCRQVSGGWFDCVVQFPKGVNIGR